MSGVALNLYRGGSDESTFGPMLELNNCQFENVGKGKRNKAQAAISLHGVQYAIINNNNFRDSQPLKLHLVVGEPITKIMNTVFENTGKIIANDAPYETENLIFK